MDSRQIVVSGLKLGGDRRRKGLLGVFFSPTLETIPTMFLFSSSLHPVCLLSAAKKDEKCQKISCDDASCTDASGEDACTNSDYDCKVLSCATTDDGKETYNYYCVGKKYDPSCLYLN